MARISVSESLHSDGIATRKRQFWQRHCARWQRGSGSKLSYCREHSLNYHQFIYWHKRIITCEAVENDPIAKCALVPVTVSPAHETTESSGLQVTLPNGLCIAGIGAHNLDLVSTLIATL